MATLGELTASSRRLALVGLAKNTGKTVTLAALLNELAAAERRVGVTSVGRDGEEHDVIDFRIDKPPVKLVAGSLVATTDGLLRASGIPHELLERTGIRTPLGEVLIAGLKGAGSIEVAGPSAASDARRVADVMLEHGAEQVLIDGAIDRRAASSPDVADGLVTATGAILSEDLEEVVQRTADAIALVRLPGLEDGDPESARVRELAEEQEPGISLMLDERLQAIPLPPRFVLTAQAPDVAEVLGGSSTPRWLLISGALPEAFLEGLLPALRRARASVKVLVSDPTRVFLSRRGPADFAAGGIDLMALHAIDLMALTVNPVAPQSHSFDSARLRERLAETIPGVPIFDVMHPSYAAPQSVREPARSGTSTES